MKKNAEVMQLSDELMILLKVCFYMNVFSIVLFLTYPLFIYINIRNSAEFRQDDYTMIMQIISLPSLVLWLYCIYFYFRYDRYSSAGLKLFFLNFIFSPVYFYKVIWKRRRSLRSNFKSEPILGNTIKIENYED